MKPLIILAACLSLTSGCGEALTRVQTGVGYAVDISDDACEAPTRPRTIKACAALFPLLPVIRAWLPAQPETPVG